MSNVSKKPRGVFISGNWKMYNGQSETAGFFKELRAKWNESLSKPTLDAIKAKNIRAMVIPPNISLEKALESARGLPVEVGAQNVHWEKNGAFTGEISGPMLKEIGINTALVAHSERRQYFGETDETANKRLESLLKQGIQVIFCLGETKTEREAGQTEKVLLKQLDSGLPKPGSEGANFLDGRLVIAYEPVWAIGTGLTATPQQAEEAHQFIRKYLWDRFGMAASAKTQILYGGSVKPDNILALLECPNIDGGLVGGASLKPESFLALLEGAGKTLT